MGATSGHPTAQPYSRAGLLAKLTGAATLAVGAFLVGQGTSQLASTGSALTYSGGIFQIAGSVPGTPTAGQVFVGGGQVKAGGGITCTTLMTSGAVSQTINHGTYIENGNAWSRKTVLASIYDSALGTTTDRVRLVVPTASAVDAELTLNALGVLGLRVSGSNVMTVSGSGGITCASHVVGTDPGGIESLRVGGGGRFNGGLVLSAAITSTVAAPSGTTGIHPWVSGATSLVALVSSGAAANEKIWDIRHNGTTFQIAAAADNYSSSSAGITIGRTGNSADKIGFLGAAAVARPSLAAATGTATRTTYDTATVTLSQLAERVKAIIDDLRGYGLEG